MRIYMDVCCLNRPFDDLRQERVNLEAESILAILSHCQKKEWILAASSVIEYELMKISNLTKLEKVQALYSVADIEHRLVLTDEVRSRARLFQNHKIKYSDSLHLALAETSGQDVFLTTDDKLLTAARKLKDIGITVSNPVVWLMEVLGNG